MGREVAGLVAKAEAEAETEVEAEAEAEIEDGAKAAEMEDWEGSITTGEPSATAEASCASRASTIPPVASPR